MPREKPPIIVISSHVAEGAVGNRAAVFALERLGFPVIAVPTVVMAWHPGVGRATRIVPPAEAFAALIADLAGAAWLGPVGAVLSGYLGEASQAGRIAALVEAARARNPDMVYLCDPVLGDGAGPYVSDKVIAATAERLLPLADIATPNRHELRLVGHDEATDNAGLVAAARATGVGEVVVTSAFAGPGEAASLLVTPEGAHLASHAALAAAPNGTGDLLAALYLARRLDGAAALEALEMAAASTFDLARMADGRGALPLAAWQQRLLAPQTSVTLTTIA